MHLIEKNQIEIKCSNKALAEALRDDLGSLFKNDVYPKLENLLDQFDFSDSIWRIDRLPVHIASLPEQGWQGHLINQILEQIEAFLIANKPKRAETKDELESTMIVKELSRKQMLVHYLRHGYLPPNAITEDLNALFKSTVIDKDFWKILSNDNTYESEEWILRWTLNVPEDIQKKLADNLDLGNQFGLMNDILKNEVFEEDTSLRNICLFLNFVFWITIYNRQSSSDVLSQNLWLKSQKYFPVSLASILHLIEIFKRFSWQGSRDIVDAYLNELIKLKSYLDKVFKRSEIQEVDDQKSPSENTGTVSEKAKEQKEIEALLEAIQGTNKESQAGESKNYYIENAGLIILHPFLSTLFQKLNYWNGISWANEMAANRAVLLTQYLVSGKTKIFESELLLNKLLCGFSFNETVRVDWEITEEEQNQCEELLKSVIEHWAILKNTSPATLQETFLLRKGKLQEYKANTFELTVENQSIDLLLDHLPWGISTIKTPWMEEYLSCNWN